ncbi:SCP2 sterol-binding domain-containing protein [Lentibacillus sp. CBA3610]|uniref:SCP2 sterol-binding domain-containing protein n=1 Tax=Lentibacillus sp. CBA3610 TaxID=2518176 RepID=UPI0015950185|nr:SCP2 sterol-binding domain-containing protein [Lentibacillus sp. CBA3610]QKY68753.1 SCP2 sterol-binding domain-containing protein [Lentibacillus sp. CBA3610]
MADVVKPNSVEVFEMIDAALKYGPSATEGKEGVYQFNLQGDDRGTFQIIIDEEGPRAVEGAKADPQCTLEISTDDFRNMVGGTLNPTSAFMGGKLKIKGNMGLVLKLQTVLNSFSF